MDPSSSKTSSTHNCYMNHLNSNQQMGYAIPSSSNAVNFPSSSQPSCALNYPSSSSSSSSGNWSVEELNSMLFRNDEFDDFQAVAKALGRTPEYAKNQFNKILQEFNSTLTSRDYYDSPKHTYNAWSVKEHRLFLVGVEYYNTNTKRNNWKSITKVLLKGTRSVHQVGSHAQKFRIHQEKKKAGSLVKKKASIFDEDKVDDSWFIDYYNEGLIPHHIFKSLRPNYHLHKLYCKLAPKGPQILIIN